MGNKEIKMIMLRT